jgi:hypothetical protein
MSIEVFKNYKKNIYKPVNERRQVEMTRMNKKSVYKKFLAPVTNDSCIQKLAKLPDNKPHAEKDMEEVDEQRADEMI